MDNDSYARPTCHEMRRRFPIPHALAVLTGAMIGLLLLIAGYSVVRDLARLVLPAPPIILSASISPMVAGFSHLKIVYRSLPSKSCIRQRIALISEGPWNPEKEVQEYQFIGATMNGMGLGATGVFVEHFTVPPYIRGVWTMHTRAEYTCPIGRLLVAFSLVMSKQQELHFPDP